jgi:uncharacterized protein YijF (DUF1287 family)
MTRTGKPGRQPWLICCLLQLAPALALADSQDIVSAARAQVGVTLRYDPAYRTLRYPGGAGTSTDRTRTSTTAASRTR